jgi:trimeric autotransporter adhesin
MSTPLVQHRGMRRIALLAVTAIAAVLAGLLVAPAASAAGTVDTTIGGFESAGEGWQIAQNGATGTFTTPNTGAHGGSQYGRVTGSFPNGTGYIDLSRGGLPQVDMQSLSFWIKSTGIDYLTLRLTDSTGQAHQRGFAVTRDGAEWSQVVITDFAAGGHFGGADDGAWHGPMSAIDIILDSSGLAPGATDASVSVDDVVISAPAPALLLGQSQLGNVFTPDETTTFPVTTSADTLTWTATDVDGAVAASGTQAVTSADAAITITKKLALGWYGLAVTASAGGTTIGTASTTFARLATPPSAAAAAASPFGVSTHMPGYPAGAVSVLRKAGMGNIRDDMLWSNTELTAGSYDWSWGDGYATAVQQQGIQPLFVAGYGNPLYDGGHAPTSDAGIAAYADYVLAIVKHYGGASLPGIEIWNEYQLGLDGSTETSPAAYVKMLKAVSAKVKAVYPTLPILGPADAHFDDGWLEQAFQAGALAYVDGVVIHPYNFPGPAEQLDASLDTVQALIAKYNGGAQKPIWITETGWSSGTDGQGVSEASQASNEVRAQLIAASRGVAKTYTYVLVNEGTDPVNYYPNLGMMHNPGDPLGALTPKPAYVAYATMTNQLTGAAFQKRDAVGTGVYSLAFTKGSASIRAIWSPQPSTVSLTASGPVTVADMYGRTRTLQPGSNGRIALAVSDAVQYVTGATAAQATKDALVLDPAFVNRPLTGHWTYDNTAGTASATVRLTIGGTTVDQTVAAGAVGTAAVQLPARSATGPVSVTGVVSSGGADIGVLTASTTVSTVVTVTGGRALDASGAPVLRIRVANRTPDPLTLTGLTYTVAGSSGSALAGSTLAGSATAIVDLPAALTLAGDWSARVAIAGQPDATASGTLVATSQAPTTVDYHPITVDGALDDLTGATAIDLDTQGTRTLSPDGGAADLGGTVWLTYDEKNLYLSAKITDDVHAQFSTGNLTWNGDSIQLGVSNGAPGEQKPAFSELTMALTSNGPELWRGSALLDAPGPVDGAKVDITRDETAKVTDYEVAVPWARLDGIQPSDRILSASLVVNDNDGNGRKGFIEWGQGIATSKDDGLFKLMELAPAPVRSADASLKALTVAGAPVAGFDPATTAYDVTLPFGTATAPKIAATATDSHATVVVHQAATPSSAATVDVTAQDGTVRTYTVRFTVADHPACTKTLTGSVSALVVAKGVVCLDHASVRGSVLVTSGASLVATASTVGGSFTALAAKVVIVRGSTVGGSAAILGDRGVTELSGNTFRGSLTCLLDVPAPTDAGHPNIVRGARIGQCRGAF